MPRFSANLTVLYPELAFLDRFAAAARAGFSAVECQLPYAFEAGEIRSRLDAHGLSQVLFNMPAGDWTAGDRGIACDPGRTEEFAAGIDRALAYAAALRCGLVNCLAGKVPEGVDRNAARDTLLQNLAAAAPQFASAGVRLLIEPINTRDVPGFFLTNSAQAVDIIRDVGSDNLFLQYDAYHMQVMEGDLTRTIERCLPAIAHIQIADVPDRHEPGSGEINFEFLLRRLDEIGYPGWVGLEYNPAALTDDGLVWLERLGWAAAPGKRTNI